MANALTTITNLINSPPGQLVAGSALGGIVWKFFERVEAVLNEDSKLEIAVWLLGMRTAERVRSWPVGFLALFDSVFGTVHPSWQGLQRCLIMTIGCYVLSLILTGSAAVSQVKEAMEAVNDLEVGPRGAVVLLALGAVAVGGVMSVPDYASLLASRNVIAWASVRRKRILGMLGSIVLSLTYSLVMYGLSLVFAWTVLDRQDSFHNFYLSSIRKYGSHPILALIIYAPLFFTSSWLLLYVSSALTVRAARRFDIGFQWFNRKFDIEKKPLQSIGLVAGALVAMVYWTAVIVNRVA